MTNHEVFEAFAAGQPGESGSARSLELKSGWFALYSYATPIALRTPSGQIVFGERRYSATTSKQITQARRSCPGSALIEQDLFVRDLIALGAELGRAAS